MVKIICDNPVYFFENISGIYEFIIKNGSSIIYIFLNTSIDVYLSIIIMCEEVGASADVRIIHYQKNNQKIILSTLQQHNAPHTNSTVLVKGVLFDASCFDYTGKIYVGLQAHGTEAQQKSHTLLLSSGAQAKATPSLEVLTDSVQCKHGSAIAGLDFKTLEYLASRSITFSDAQKILVDSFFFEACQHARALRQCRELAENNSVR